jgi:hypothetical protein
MYQNKFRNGDEERNLNDLLQKNDYLKKQLEL